MQDIYWTLNLLLLHLPNNILQLNCNMNIIYIYDIHISPNSTYCLHNNGHSFMVVAISSLNQIIISGTGTTKFFEYIIFLIGYIRRQVQLYFTLYCSKL